MAKQILRQESSDPTPPAANYWDLYFRSGGLYIEDSAGNVIGPMGPTAAGGNGIQGLMVWDEGTPLNTGTILNVVGSRLQAAVSGTVILLSSSPDPQPVFGIMGRAAGVNLGTGTILDVITSGRLTFSISGTVLALGSTPEPMDNIGIMGQDEGINLGTGTVLNAVGSRLYMSISGTVLNLGISPDPSPVFGIMGRDEGTNLGTGTVLNFQGQGVVATLSGTVLTANIPGNWGINVLMGDGSGTFPVGNQIGPFELPFDCIMEQWTLLADVTGSIQLRIKQSTYAGYPPATTLFSPSMSNLRKQQTTIVVTGTAGDIIQVNIETASTLKQASLSIRGRRNIT